MDDIENEMLGNLYSKLKNKKASAIGLPARDLALMSQLKN